MIKRIALRDCSALSKFRAMVKIGNRLSTTLQQDQILSKLSTGIPVD
jgi:hypothetical protein